MKRSGIVGGVVVVLMILGGLGVLFRRYERRSARAEDDANAVSAEPHPSLLYGRVAARGGEAYEGRLRFSGNQEAFWSDTFIGTKTKNAWAEFVPRERLPMKREGVKVFGFELWGADETSEIRRLFMARFGDIARIEGGVREVKVTLKSGTVAELARSEASDFDDGVRVWDGRQGMVDLDSLKINAIEFLPSAPAGADPRRLFGTVRSRQGEFTGFVQWNRHNGLGSDTLYGRVGESRKNLRFDTIRSIAKEAGGGLRVTLNDGQEIALSGTREAGEGQRGAYVDDERYGRVLVSWDAFERVNFRAGGSGPTYEDFKPGRALNGTVIARGGKRFTGRLVYDLDESETTETLDAPREGVDYTILFSLIAAIEPGGGEERATVTLRSGEVLRLEERGDLGEGNAGMLVFVKGQARPEYVAWSEVERIEFDGARQDHQTRKP